MGIEWKEGDVCFAAGTKWDSDNDFSSALDCNDFQLNTIKQGDYIEASELDTEQKYNDAVEVFGLFGFFRFNSYEYKKTKSDFESGAKRLFLSFENYIMTSPDGGSRKLTYRQLMAIGKLKRLGLKRDNEPQFGKNEDGSMKLIKSNNSAIPNSCEDVVNKPSHYQFFEGVEVIEIIASSMTREQFKGYCLGNRIKYRLRAGNKDKLEQEIAKSDKYVELYDEYKHLCK